jgi:hypothetical protein
MATTATIKKNIAKLEAALKSKATPKSLKPKLETQLVKSKAELSGMSKGTKPKTSSTKSTQTALQKLKTMVNKNKKYKTYKGAGVDLEKDADRPAKPIGRRTAKASGKTYYEYRANRIDVKQPPKRYPKLEKGGYMADGGEIYKMADNMTDAEYEKKLNSLNAKQKNQYDILVRLGDSPKLALATTLLSKEPKWDDVTSRAYTMAKGGMSQGYDDREDERLGMKDGKMSTKDLHSTHARRDDARFEERMAKGGVLQYESILDVLKQKIDDSIEELPSDYQTAAETFKGEEVEHESRDGFIAYTDGGYEARWFDNISNLNSSGISLPTMGLDAEMQRQVDYNYEYAKDRFKDEYPEIVEELGEDNIEYNSLQDSGYDDEAEQLSEWEMNYDGDDTIMMEISAFYYSPTNYRGLNNKHTIFLFANVNLESPYHRSGNLEDGVDHTFTFNSLEELKEKMDENLKKIVDWFDGKNYKEGKKDLKVTRMAKGGYMAKGGISQKEVAESNAEMVLSQIKAVKHHAQELSNVVSKNSDIEAWVVAKIERASTDLSDITHYLEFQTKKMAMGGEMHRSEGNTYSKGGSVDPEKYPELQKIADKIADETAENINKEVKDVKSNMPYKAQWVLEEVVKDLKNRI